MTAAEPTFPHLPKCQGNLILRRTPAGNYYLVCDRCPAVLSVDMYAPEMQWERIEQHLNTGRDHS